MNQLRLFGRLVLAIALLVVGAALSGPAFASPATDTPPEVPGDIAVPAGSVLLFSSHARGVQIYECKSGQWAFHAPRARLFDPVAHGTTGTHYGGIDAGLTAGPWWESDDDGSRIRGGVVKPAPSPNPDSIPLLLLKVQEWYGNGVFTPVTHIQRLNTEGGVGPTGACAGHARRSVPYTADYYFYAAP
jgi:hypothetical protein